MKRILSILLLVCLLLGCCSVSLAAAPVITSQPETVSVTAGGKVTYSVRAKNIGGLTWYFVDPATGEKASAKHIREIFPDLKVPKTNSKDLTLQNVPEAMHGWTLYCHITKGRQEVDSDPVTILISGMGSVKRDTAEPSPAPEQASVPAPAVPETTPVPEPTAIPEVPGDAQEPAAPETEPVPAAEPAPEAEASPAAEAIPADEEEEFTGPVTVTAEGASLYLLNRRGRPEKEPAETLTFEGPASFYVAADGPLSYFSLNGIRITPDDAVSGFYIYDLKTDAFIQAFVDRTAAPAEAAPVQEAVSVETFSVTCENCRFTGGGLKYAVSGEVPSGTVITVIAGSSGNLNRGYSINGEEYGHQGMATFRLTVTENVTVTMQPAR